MATDETDREAYLAMRKLLADAGFATLKEAAEWLGVTESHLHHVLTGRRQSKRITDLITGGK